MQTVKNNQKLVVSRISQAYTPTKWAVRYPEKNWRLIFRVKMWRVDEEDPTDYIFITHNSKVVGCIDVYNEAGVYMDGGHIPRSLKGQDLSGKYSVKEFIIKYLTGDIVFENITTQMFISRLPEKVRNAINRYLDRQLDIWADRVRYRYNLE